MNKYKLLVFAVVMIVVGGFYFNPIRVHAASQWDYDTDCGDSTDSDVTGCSPNRLEDLPDSLVPVQNTAGNYTTPINVTLNGGAPGTFSPSYQLWKIKKLGHYVAYSKHVWTKDQVVLKSCQTNIPNYKPLQWAISSESSDWLGYYMKGSPTVLGGKPADTSSPLQCGNARTNIYSDATKKGAYASDGSSYGPMSNKTVSDSGHHIQSFNMDFCSYGTVNVNVKTDGNSALPTGYTAYSVAGPFGIDLPIQPTTKTVDTATKSWADARFGSYRLTGAAPTGYTVAITPSESQSISCATGQVITFNVDFTSTAAPDACGPGSGATPKQTEPTGTSACTTGTYANSPADTVAAWNWSCGTITTCSAPKYGCTTATDTNYIAGGANNILGCAGTCANGQTNYPTCTAAGMTGTLTAPNCTIPSGSSSCNTSLTWATTNPVGTSSVTSPVNNSGASSSNFHVSVPDANSGTNVSAPVVPVVLPATTSRAFYLYNNSVLLAQAAPVATCVSGNIWDTASGTCIVGAGTTGTLIATNCRVASGESSCPSSLSWTTTNPAAGATSVVTTPTNITVGTGNNSSATYYITPASSRTFSLKNNNVSLATATPAATCVSGTAFNYTSGNCEESSMTGTLTAVNCAIPLGGSSCSTTFSWSITHSVGNITAITSSDTDMVVDTSTPPVSKSGTKSYTFTAPVTDKIFYLYNDGASLVATSQFPNGSGIKVSAYCASGSWQVKDGIAKCVDTCPTPPAGGTCPLWNSCHRVSSDGVLACDGVTCVGTPPSEDTCSGKGACSSPNDHLRPCVSGSPSPIIDSPSKWTWKCVGFGPHAISDSCSEEHSPIIIEH